MKLANTDLEDTLELKPIRHKKNRFPFFAKVGISLGIFLSLILIVHSMYHAIHGTNISLLTNETPTFIGFDGYGSIQEDFHPEKDAIEQLSQKYISQEKSGKDTSSLKTLTKSIACSFSKQDHLSNGMVIQYTCSYDSNAAKKTNYHFSNTTKSYTVTSLQKLNIFDPFKDLETSWNMQFNIPQLQLIPDKTSNELNIQYHYSYTSQTSALVTISYDEEKLKQSGWIIQNKEKEITFKKTEAVLSLTEINSASILTDSFMEYVQNDLSKCTTVAFGKECITAESPVLQSIQQVDDQIEVTFSLQNLYTANYPDTYHFSLTYTGSLYQNEDGQITFLTDTSHACRYEGFSQNYTMQKDVP